MCSYDTHSTIRYTRVFNGNDFVYSTKASNSKYWNEKKTQQKNCDINNYNRLSHLHSLTHNFFLRNGVTLIITFMDWSVE